MQQPSKALKLHNVQTGKDFTPTRSVPSAKVRAQLRDIAARYEADAVEVAARAVLPEGELTDAVAVEFCKTNPEEAKKNIRQRFENQNHQDRKVLEMCQVVINTSKLSEEDRAAVEEDVTVEDGFWQNQNMEEITEWVDSFCGRNNIG